MQTIKNEEQKSLQEKSSTEAFKEFAKDFKIYNPQYENIELSEEEIKEALRLARRDKEKEIKIREYWAKVDAPIVYPKYTPDELLIVIKKIAKEKLGVDFKETNPKIINELLNYFTETPGYFNSEKGILLCGGVGVGKTTLMKLFSENQKASFQIISCRKVAQNWVSGGDDGKGGYKAIEKYWKTNHINSNKFGQNKIGICFDDLGTESDKKNFGNELNAMTEIILNRYDNPALKGITHFTTNLSGDEIEKFYGTRVRSRLREMVNKFDFNQAIDLRK